MILTEEKVNLGRQREFDVVKALAILFMITVHVYEELSAVDSTVICASAFDVIIQFLGGPLAAPVFMFALGLGISYSSHRTPEELMKRGVWLLAFSYLFNILRFTLPYMLVVKLADMEILSYAVHYLTFHVDILTFAGLSFLLTGLLKKCKVSVWGVVVIAIVLQAVGALLTSLFSFESELAVYLTAPFFKCAEQSYFPLFQWYIYPALGLLYAKYLRHIKDTDKLYLILLSVSGSVILAFVGAFAVFGLDLRVLFTLADDLYYNQTLLHVVFTLACILLELSVVHFIMKVLHLPKLEKVLSFMSGKLNQIYILQWIIIGWASYFIPEENLLTYPWIVPVGILLTALSTVLVYLYTKWKKKRQSKKETA